MIISFEILYNDEFLDYQTDLTNHKLDDVIDIIMLTNDINSNCNYICYENKNLINGTFNEWNSNNKYYLFLNCEDDTININIKKNDNIVSLPKIKLSTFVQDIKTIFNIDDDLYYNNVKLDDYKQICYYNIENNSILECNTLMALCATKT